MANEARRGFRGFAGPLEIVDRTDLDYADRLAMLQEWKAELAQTGAPQEAQDELQGAIQALEMGAAVQDDAPEEAPEDHGYGAQREG
jgi:hypothetical protein